MDLMNIAQELITQKLGSKVDSDMIASGIKSLLGGDSGNLDLSSLMAGLGQNGALIAVVGSWLGDGKNESISPSAISDLFGSDNVAGFASKLGMDTDSASSLLADVVPEMVDKSSSGGSLLDSVGGLDNALDMAKKFF